MSDPIVTAVILADGDSAKLKRVIRCYLDQSYPNKRMLVYGVGAPSVALYKDIKYQYVNNWDANRPIGEIRNDANVCTDGDILMHFDADDWHHVDRMTEQVAFLQSSGQDCVGYHDMLCWDVSPGQFCGAWQYASERPYCVPGSMAYWRAVWAKEPFLEAGNAWNQVSWLDRANIDSATSNSGVPVELSEGKWEISAAPRMIAGVQGEPSKLWLDSGSRTWQRRPDFDKYVRSVMVGE